MCGGRGRGGGGREGDRQGKLEAGGVARVAKSRADQYRNERMGKGRVKGRKA